MSREIKFRVWDKQLSKWYEPIYEAWRGELFEILIGVSGQINIRSINSNGGMILEHESLPKYKDRFILIQFTGLLDKKGKEIYEGDAVKSSIQPPHEWSGLHEVVFENGAFMIKGGNPHGRRYGEAFNYFPRNVEVVSNIYENPELLK